MLAAEYLKQHAGLLQSLIVLISCVPISKSFHTHRDYESNNRKLCRENCTTINECCPFYFCIDGTCEKPGSNFELIVLAKVTLEIAFAILLSAIFVFVLRSLLNAACGRFQGFQRGATNARLFSSRTYFRTNPRPSSCQTSQDKPPSYEECIRSPREPISDLPPPYTISGHLPSELTGNEMPACNNNIRIPQNFTPLDAQALGKLFGNYCERKKSPAPEN